jgi:tetratricopeptide (TPR) repeat protein
LEEASASAPADAPAKSDLIKAYDSLAFLMTRAGGNSRELVEKALKLYEELEQTEPADDARRMQYVELLIRSGDTAVGFENNLREHLKALPVVEQLIARDPNNPEKLRQSARSSQRVGTDYQRLGEKAENENRAADAREFYRQSLEYQRRMFAAAEKLHALDPEKPSNRRYLALAHLNLSHALSKNNQSDEALEALEKARLIVEENLRRDSHNRESKFDLSVVHEIFASVYERRGETEKALASRKKSLALDEEIYQADKGNIEVLNRIVKNYEMLAAHADRARAEFYRRKFDAFSSEKAALANE